MKIKENLQSKTVNSALLIIIVAILNIMGLFEATPGQTYDTMLELQGRQGEQIKNLLLMGGGAGAIFGRNHLNKKLGKKKEAGDENDLG